MMSHSHPPKTYLHNNSGYCWPVWTLLNIRRRHFRRSLSIIVVFFTIVFILKIQHLISDLNQTKDASSHLNIHWTLTKVVSHRPRLDFDASKDKLRFDRLGVELMKDSKLDNGKGNTSIRYFSTNGSNHTSSPGRQNVFKNVSLPYIRNDQEKKPVLFRPYPLGNVEIEQSENELKDSIRPGFKLQPKTEESLKTFQNSSQATPKPIPSTSTVKQGGAFLTVLVISRPNNVLLRQAVRKTWGQNADDLGVEVRFVVGREENWNDIVDREYTMHNDVIILEEEDTYDNLPNKVLDGFIWALRQPKPSNYIMKVDDDSIINLPYLIQELNTAALNTTQILGAICVNATVVRDPSDKWAVSILDYPFPTYPTYAFGGGYVMTASAASLLVETRSKTFDWIHLEDVYITGILAMKALFSHITHPGFSFWMSEKATPCDFVLNRRITSVSHSQKEFYSMYSDIQTLLRSDNFEQCKSPKQRR